MSQFKGKWTGLIEHGMFGDLSIDNLIKALEKWTIVESFFFSYTDKDGVKLNHNPIKKEGDLVKFFGSFEEEKMRFNICTFDAKLIKHLTEIIRRNKGWKQYYKKHLVEPQQSLF